MPYIVCFLLNLIVIAPFKNMDGWSCGVYTLSFFGIANPRLQWCLAGWKRGVFGEGHRRWIAVDDSHGGQKKTTKIRGLRWKATKNIQKPTERGWLWNIRDAGGLGYIPYPPWDWYIYTYICLICFVNVGKYTIHGRYEYSGIYCPVTWGLW